MNRKMFAKIIALILCCVLVVGVFASCKKINDRIDNLQTDVDKTEADLATLKALVEDVDAVADAAVTAEELEAALQTLDTEKLSNFVGKGDLQETVDTLVALIDAKADQADIDAAIANLQTALDAFKTEINNKIKALNDTIDGLTSNEEWLGKLLDAIKDDLKAITVETVEESFHKASEVLTGEKWVVLENGKVKELVAPGTAGATEYSFEAYADKVMALNRAQYADAELDAYEEKCENMQYFLLRAASVQAVVNYFGAIDAYVEAMPTLLESLREAVDAITTLTNDSTQLDDVTPIYDKIVANGIDLATEDADLYEDYTTLVGAHDNILAAYASTLDEDAEALIEAIDYVVYTRSLTAIEDAEAAVKAFVDEFFANEAYNAYYTIEATDLVENYATVVNARARYTQLTNANAVVANDPLFIISVALRFDSVKPLWSDKAAIDANVEAYNAWLAEYEIDETDDAESLDTILGDKELLLKKAKIYADAMYSVYANGKFINDTYTGVAALNTAIDALLAEGILLENKAEYDAFNTIYEGALKALLIAALDATVLDAVGYEANLEGMLNDAYTGTAADRETEFKAAYGALDIPGTVLGLVTADEDLDDLYDEMYDYVGRITYNDGDMLQGWADEIAAIYTANNVTKGDANYVEMAKVKDVNTLLAALYVEYDAATARIRAIYDNVYDNLIAPYVAQDAATKSLKFGLTLMEYTKAIGELHVTGVTNIYLPLPGTEDREPVNLNELYAKHLEIVKWYGERATAAQTAAAEIANLLADKDANLNNYEDITNAYENLNAWIATWLVATGDVAEADKANAETIAAALNAIKNVPVYNGNGATYTFVSAEIYTECNAKNAAVTALYAAAEIDWKTGKEGAASLLAQLQALDEAPANAIKAYVHNYADYVKVEAAYAAYVNAYYAGAIVNAQFDELTTYAAFAEILADCKDAKAQANAKIAEIEAAIAAVLAETDPATILTLAAEAEARIAEYATFCDNKLTDTCLNHELLLDFYQAKATAEFKEYVAAAAASNPAMADKLADIQNQHEQFISFGDIKDVEGEAQTLTAGIAQVEGALAAAKTAVDEALATVNNNTGNLI